MCNYDANSISKTKLNLNRKHIIDDSVLMEYAGTNKDTLLNEMAIKAKYLDKIKGSFFGGAIGDALGYPVEFMNISQIQEKYGASGICEYELDKNSGLALISDDTQMTLFTANGILVCDTRYCLRGIGGQPCRFMPTFYTDWLITQTVDFETGHATKRIYGQGKGMSWLLDVPQLYSRRAPGITCISALRTLDRNMCDRNMRVENFITNPVNNSKGCGGIMRVAPLGLHYNSVEIERLDKEAALISAITHGHSLGYMPSSVLTHILNRIVYPKDGLNTLEEIIIEARDTVVDMFKDDKHIDELKNIIDLAIQLSKNNKSDLENIQALGEGWVAEETLAIAIYCSLRHQNDFSNGIIAAVNHSGDSDSTGAVTGNILGALLGYDNIENKWKNNLELFDVINEMAEDICFGCNMVRYGEYIDPMWGCKYAAFYWKKSDMYQNLY